MGSSFGPVAITPYGVDLAIMGQETEWLGQTPLRPGIGREPLVENTE
jgi:hypothetical protein